MVNSVTRATPTQTSSTQISTLTSNQSLDKKGGESQWSTP